MQMNMNSFQKKGKGTQKKKDTHFLLQRLILSSMKRRNESPFNEYHDWIPNHSNVSKYRDPLKTPPIVSEKREERMGMGGKDELV